MTTHNVEDKSQKELVEIVKIQEEEFAKLQRENYAKDAKLSEMHRLIEKISRLLAEEVDKYGGQECEFRHEIDELQQELQAERQRVLVLANVVESAIECMFSGCDYNALDIQEACEEAGIIVLTKYDPSTHGDNDVDAEKGDPWYEYSMWFARLSNQLRQQAKDAA
ncbi:hypothetical protein LJ739_06995 [Aestuariibacter halophilus]|uniref:Uncharacterized protein n=1 Tax=Fluctibacter halophilus TaxID=226011 RepID=A0ABS8G8G5_9ALTE|nr:hypothetical protein [Aestuariibacter halophilus]MCC2615984.1 hypothetical protein [Aestuariibacter halophilus]